MLKLILPDTKYLDSYLEALKEGYRIGIRPIPSDEEIAAIKNDPFPHLESQNMQGGSFTPEDGIERKKVPDNIFWLVDEDSFIGGVNIRYELNDFLEKHAGHMGYGVRPSKKRQGYATKMVGMALSKLRTRGVTKVMITAAEENIGSWKAVEANGGVLTDIIDNIFSDGGKSKVYWIELEGMCG